ncbi:MAG: sigma-70 family RNA polymerase sigma factor [Chloroflexi bacterium]|nr:sigma-70 family RNA polymerase sigma factor [Chloroflexota bacterium]
MGTEPGTTDEELALLSRNGDLAAFNSLVDRYQDAVYGLCLRLVGRREAAEDATQETFLSAYRAISRFGGGNFRGWLLRIAANQSKDELRRRRRKDGAASLDEAAEAAGAPIEVIDPAADTVAVVEQAELSAALGQALAELPFEQRQAIVLADLYDYHYDEVAEMTHASVGTVKSRIHRGRERLRGYLLSHPELLAGYRRLEGREE